MLPELALSSSALTHMPSPQLPNYLKSHRKRLDLSQAEVALLMGAVGREKVCRDERFAREPSLATALAYEALYQVPIRELFAGLYHDIELQVKQRAQTLAGSKEFQGNQAQAIRKLATLRRIGAAASAIPSTR